MLIWFMGEPESDLFAESIRIEHFIILCRCMIGLGASLFNFSTWLICLLLFGAPFLNRVLQICFFLICQLTGNVLNEICQDQTRSDEINQDRQAQTANAACRNKSRKPRAPKLTGRRCHAAWRLQSAPGSKAPEACLARKSLSLPIFFILMSFSHHSLVVGPLF